MPIFSGYLNVAIYSYSDNKYFNNDYNQQVANE